MSRDSTVTTSECKQVAGQIREIRLAASGAVNVPRCMPERTAGPRLTGSRRRFALPAQDEQGDVVSGVLASDQGSHHR